MFSTRISRIVSLNVREKDVFCLFIFWLAQNVLKHSDMLLPVGERHRLTGTSLQTLKIPNEAWWFFDIDVIESALNVHSIALEDLSP